MTDAQLDPDDSDFIEKAERWVEGELKRMERTSTPASLLDSAAYARELAARADVLDLQRRVWLELAERFEVAASGRPDV